MTMWFVLVLFLTVESGVEVWNPIPQSSLKQCEEKVEEVAAYLSEVAAESLFFVACVEVTEGENV